MPVRVLPATGTVAPKAQTAEAFYLVGTKPVPNRYGTSAVSYLQDRGIDADIISRCIAAGILYESRRHQNCAFVGRDPSGMAQFACLRGIHGGFKMDVEGSDKRYSFCLSPEPPVWERRSSGKPHRRAFRGQLFENAGYNLIM